MPLFFRADGSDARHNVILSLDVILSLYPHCWWSPATCAHALSCLQAIEVFDELQAHLSAEHLAEVGPKDLEPKDQVGEVSSQL
jgi:hypothetical protein